MSDHPLVRNIRFTPASDRECSRGLLGFISFRYGDLLIDGVTVRKTRDSRIVLSFPLSHSKSGRQHANLRPIDARARAEIEAAILGALDLPEHAAVMATKPLARSPHEVPVRASGGASGEAAP